MSRENLSNWSTTEALLLLTNASSVVQQSIFFFFFCCFNSFVTLCNNYRDAFDFAQKNLSSSTDNKTINYFTFKRDP
jgi:hypothetical protein